MDAATTHVLDLIEAAYLLEHDDETWLRGLANGFEMALGDRSGTIAFIARELGEPDPFECEVGVNVDARWHELRTTVEQTPRWIHHTIARCGPLLYWSQIYPALTARANDDLQAFYDRRAKRCSG